MISELIQHADLVKVINKETAISLHNIMQAFQCIAMFCGLHNTNDWNLRVAWNSTFTDITYGTQLLYTDITLKPELQ